MRRQRSNRTSDEASSSSWQEASRYDARSPRSINSDGTFDRSSVAGSSIGHDDPTLVHANFQTKRSYDLKRVHSEALDSFLTVSYSEDDTRFSEVEETRDSLEARDGSSEDRFQQQLAELDQTQEAWKATQAARSNDSIDEAGDFYLKEVGELTVLSPRKKKYFDVLNETIYEEEEPRESRENDIREERESEKPSESEAEDPIDTTNNQTLSGKKSKPRTKMVPGDQKVNDQEHTSSRNKGNNLRPFKAESATEISKPVELPNDHPAVDAVEPTVVRNGQEVKNSIKNSDGVESSRVVSFGSSFDFDEFPAAGKRASKSNNVEHKVDQADLKNLDRRIDLAFIDLEDNVVVPNTTENAEKNDTNEIIKAVQARLFNSNSNKRKDAPSTESDESSDNENDPEFRSYLPANLCNGVSVGSPRKSAREGSRQNLSSKADASKDEDDASKGSKQLEKRGKCKIMILNSCIILAVIGAIVCSVFLVIEIRGSRSGKQSIDTEYNEDSDVKIDNNGYTITLIDNGGNSTESIDSKPDQTSGEKAPEQSSTDASSSEGVPSSTESIDQSNENQEEIENSKNNDSPTSDTTVDQPEDEIAEDTTAVEVPTSDNSAEDSPSPEVIEEPNDVAEDNSVVEETTNDNSFEDSSPAEVTEKPNDIADFDTIFGAPTNGNSPEDSLSSETVEQSNEILEDNNGAESPVDDNSAEDSSEATEEPDEILDDNTVVELVPSLDTSNEEPGAVEGKLREISGDSIYNVVSPQYKASHWLLNEDPANLDLNSITDEDLSQRYIAALLYFSMDGKRWIEQYSFLTDAHVCEWNNGALMNKLGIICNESNKITGFAINENNLRGQLPEELTLLTGMTLLQFRSNEIGGTMPRGFDRLSNLEEIDLRQNELVGVVPEAIFHLPEIKRILLLSNSQLSGTIPATIDKASNLEMLSFQKCHFKGSIPSTVGNLSNLSFFTFMENLLTGSIPESMNNLSLLEVLELSGNQMTGSIPEFETHEKLYFLSLFDNKFTGTIPNSLGDLPKLMFLDLRNNQLEGSIPPSIGDLSELVTLFVQDNKLTGTLPSFSGNDGMLQAINLSDNTLTGNIVDFFETNGPVERLVTVDFSRNNFDGSLPASVGFYDSLVDLSLDGNSFAGTIPKSIGFLTDLDTLSLGENEFSGSLPEELGLLTELVSLNVADNQLEGPIPETLNQLNNLTELYLNNNALTGDLNQAFCSDFSSGFIGSLAADCLGKNPAVACECCTSCCEGDECRAN